MPKFPILIFLLLCLCGEVLSQESLRLNKRRFGKEKTYEIHTGEYLNYRLQGEMKYSLKKIASIRDTAVFFTDETYVPMRKIAVIRLYLNHRLINTFSNVFKIGGLMFIIVDTVNGFILEREQPLNETAVIVGASMVGTGFLIQRLNVVKVRVHTIKLGKVIRMEYDQLRKK